eukprot:GGOE01008246.1.p5 GENE.GGOE01008246.1~~GGOE01008246.1.p5  ORF type:complete len:115 (-),score=0.85 GGOE01008246.1:99-443(-)
MGRSQKGQGKAGNNLANNDCCWQPAVQVPAHKSTHGLMDGTGTGSQTQAMWDKGGMGCIKEGCDRCGKAGSWQWGFMPHKSGGDRQKPLFCGTGQERQRSGSSTHWTGLLTAQG